MKEYEIGEKFEHEGVMIECYKKRFNCCTGCYFNLGFSCKLQDDNEECVCEGKGRKDGVDVGYQKLTDQYKSKAIKSLEERDGVKLGDVWAEANDLDMYMTIVFLYGDTVHYKGGGYDIEDCHTKTFKNGLTLIERDGKPVEK